ncbi:PEP-CTERM protein-sorting domain-containing protein [Sphingomonas laterariae]|uniref:PEP-CTERM protein-sorting domain-containing protein n=1 Tax=Edaphosphingomonas laterariae TaxID=861865 RepID=A0A239FYX1_9SPHN|nr:PEPxxWA-CTERM sorting domain-containing protein [Sphingomonas laterariae]SNS61482.1 PEP-CTERM protein-sorting domain-containing protein [Sphingomonas laterariae]
MKSMFLKAAAVVSIGLAAAVPAEAAVTFDIDTANTAVVVTDFDQLGWTTFSASLAGLPGAFSLEEGDSFTFDFANLNIGGVFGGGTATLEASLAFLNPGGAGSSEGAGWYAKGVVLTGGALVWDDIAPITVGGVTYKIDFSDLAGLSIHNPTVTATVTLLEDGVGGAVPEPATWAMLIAGFGMVGGAMRMNARRPALAA